MPSFVVRAALRATGLRHELTNLPASVSHDMWRVTSDWLMWSIVVSFRPGVLIGILHLVCWLSNVAFERPWKKPQTLNLVFLASDLGLLNLSNLKFYYLNFFIVNLRTLKIRGIIRPLKIWRTKFKSKKNKSRYFISVYKYSELKIQWLFKIQNEIKQIYFCIFLLSWINILNLEWLKIMIVLVNVWILKREKKTLLWSQEV